MSGLPGRVGEPIRLLVADDHNMLRSALCDVLRGDMTVVAEAGNGEDAVSLAVIHQPDLVLLDVEMPGQPVSETVQQLGDQVPRTKVVILSMYDDPHLVGEVAALGVCAYLHKSATRETLLSTLRLVATTDQPLFVCVPRKDRPSAVRPETRTPVTAALSELTVREAEVVKHVAEALSNRQIASRLGITEATVKRHLRNIFTKLDAVSRLDAVNKVKQAALSAAEQSPWTAMDRMAAPPTGSLLP